MQNIIFIKVPFVSAIPTFNIIDSFLYGISLSGNYSPIPFGDDNFDLYATGGGQFAQLFFSGSGFWNGSGYTENYNYYFYDSFDNYVTGSISGYGVTGNGLSGIMFNETGLNSGFTARGYTQSSGLFGYTVWSGYI